MPREPLSSELYDPSQVINYLPEELEALATAYERRFGNEIAADNACELFAEYSASRLDRTRNRERVAARASVLADRLLQRKLRDPDGVRNVLFTAGGTGSGKSTSVVGLRANHIVYDSTLSNVDGARRQIRTAVETGHEVVVLFLLRQPVEAFQAVLDRAVHEGAGRTVRVRTHIRTHRGAAETVLKLSDEFADNSSVRFRFLANARGDSPRPCGIERLRTACYDGLEREIPTVLKHARDSGTIDEILYRETLD